MKNKYVSGVLLGTAFCAATMTACGVYGAPEEYTEYQESSQPDSQEDEERETKNSKDENLKYDPKKDQGLCVYGPPEDFE